MTKNELAIAYQAAIQEYNMLAALNKPIDPAEAGAAYVRFLEAKERMFKLKHQLDETIKGNCTMGMDCEVYGVCYAKAVGCPEQCCHPEGPDWFDSNKDNKNDNKSA